MLKSFYVENYKSWKKGVYIDMVGESISEHPYNYVLVKNGKEKILKNLVIYGANASGKSNLLEAIEFMYEKVMEIFNERQWNRGILNEFSDDPIAKMLMYNRTKCSTFSHKKSESTFEITFIDNDIEYSYGFSLKETKVTNEWLDKNSKSIFDRKKGDLNKISEYKFLFDKVPDDELYLSYIISYAKIEENDPIHTVSSFFKQMGIFKDVQKLGGTVINGLLYTTFKRNKALIEKMNGFFEIIDFGIKRIELDKKSNKIFFYHSLEDNEVFPIYLENESLGTKKALIILLGLLPRLENGGLIISDEFTSSLHPILSKLFLDMISNPNMNRGNAQIIFTTHDVFLLRKEQFRRDEIGFIYKDNKGESKYHRLYDVKDKEMNRVRKDATYWKSYISGAYNGTPQVDYEMFINEEGVLYGKKQKK